MKYDIRIWQDDQYGVYEKGTNEMLFHGTLVQIEAWLSLREKGYEV